jgi:hypothetical protein
MKKLKSVVFCILTPQKYPQVEKNLNTIYKMSKA